MLPHVTAVWCKLTAAHAGPAVPRKRNVRFARDCDLLGRLKVMDSSVTPLRLLVVSHTAQSRAAGQARCIPLLDQSDIDCRILVPDRWKNQNAWQQAEKAADPRLRVQAARVMWPWTGRCQWYLHWYPGLQRLLRDFRPDIIHLWEEPWGLVSAQAAWLRNRYLPGTRLISETEQNIDKRLPFPFETFRRFTLSNADLLIGRTREAIGVARAKGYAGPASVVSYGIDPNIFAVRNRTEARQSYGFSGFVVGYVGRLIAPKGVEDLVQALRLLPAHVNVVFVGAGPMQASLLDTAESLGVRARVRVLSDRSAAELSKVMNGFDALALLSRTTRRWKEQFGRVIIEAHACGLPVIGSNSGAIPEVVGAGGIIVPEANVEAIASAILRLEKDSDLRTMLGRAGRTQVEAKYTWSRVSDSLLTLYRSVRRRRSGYEDAAEMLKMSKVDQR
jgi:glycosyltransferase involved in cell wall biosynthesis